MSNEAEITRGRLTFTLTSQVDQDPDLSWLGKFTENFSLYCVDRRYGYLLGEQLDEPEYPDAQDYASEDEWRRAVSEYNRELAVWHENADEQGYEILADMGQGYAYEGPRSARYYNPGLNAEQKRTLRQGESSGYSQAYRDLLRDIERNWNRLENYERGDWCMLSLVVALSLDGKELVSEGVGGVESDGGEHVRDEIRELVAALIYDPRSDVDIDAEMLLEYPPGPPEQHSWAIGKAIKDAANDLYWDLH